jgi:hypothetical protein
MKKSLYILTLIIAVSSCKGKNVWCEDIDENIKPWSVYDLNDSISMHDQNGNAALFKLDHFYNKPAYETKEHSMFSKVGSYCMGELSMSNDTDYFHMKVESSTSETDENREPDFFRFEFKLGDLNTVFSTSKENGGVTVYSNNDYTTVETNYASGGEIYPEVLLYERDSTLSPSSVYRYVYAKDKGLVEFSTKNPARTYFLD